MLSVNGVNVENVEHSFVIRLLKEAKDFIHLVVKRQLPTSGQSTHETDAVDQKQRHNLAIQQTASTVVTNFNNSHRHHRQQTHASANGKDDPMAQMTHMSSLKPFKVTLSKRDKKEAFGIVLGCKYYIKDIVPNSVASGEANLRKGDLLLKINDLSHDQFSLFTARKILQKSKESKVHLVVKRASAGSSMSSLSDDDDNDVEGGDSDLVVDETPIQVSMPPPPPPQQQQPPPPPPPPLSTSSTRKAMSSAPEVPPRPNLQNTTPKREATEESRQTSLFAKQLFKPVKANSQAETSGSSSRLSKFYAK